MDWQDEFVDEIDGTTVQACDNSDGQHVLLTVTHEDRSLSAALTAEQARELADVLSTLAEGV